MPRPRLPRICSNIRCKTVDTPLWRKGWNKDDGTNARLCNACGLHWRKGHFCPYSWCFAVYKEHETDGFVGTWLKCKRCSRWSHIACILMAKELKRRNCDKEHSNYQAVLVDVRSAVEAAIQSNPKLGESLPLPHYCPDCDVVQSPRQSRQTTAAKIAKISKSIALPSSPSKRKSQTIHLDDDYDVDDEDEQEEEENSAVETDSDSEPPPQSKKKKQLKPNKPSSNTKQKSSASSPPSTSPKFSSIRMRSTRLQKKRKVIYDDNDYENDDEDFIDEVNEEKYEYQLRSSTNGKRALGSATPSPSSSPKGNRGSPYSQSSHTSQHTDVSDQQTSDIEESAYISLHPDPPSPETKISSINPHSWTIPIRRQSSKQTQTKQETPSQSPSPSPSPSQSPSKKSSLSKSSSMRYIGTSQAANEPSESVTRVSMTMAFDMQRALNLINQEVVKESCEVQKRSSGPSSHITGSNSSNSNTTSSNSNSGNINTNNRIPIHDNMRCLWAVCEIELQNLAAL